MYWNIHYEIAAVCVTTIVLLFYLLSKRYPSRSSRIFFVLLLTTLAASVLDIISSMYIEFPASQPFWLLYLTSALFLMAENASAFVFYLYIDSLIHRDKFVFGKELGCILAVGITEMVLIATSPFTSLIFYFTPDGVYSSGPLKFVLYLVAMIMLIICMMKTLRGGQRMTLPQHLTIYLFVFGMLASVLFQLQFPHILCTGFGKAVGMVLIYLSLQNPEEYIDKQTGAFNHRAYLDMLSYYIYQKKPFDVVAIKFDEFRKVNETLGMSSGNAVMCAAVDKMRLALPDQSLYRISGVKFGVIIPHDEATSDRILSKLHDCFATSLHVDTMDLLMHSVLCSVSYPDVADTAVDIDNIIDYSLSDIAGKYRSGEIIRADKTISQGIKRRNDVTAIVNEAIRNNNFEVYYQPIYNIRTGRFSSAEALLRLHDETLGYISPAEFIPIAEENAKIIEIGDFVFRSVCHMIRDNDLRALGIEFIEVNLSPAQCIQADLAAQYNSVIKEYGIPPEMIDLEITETAAIHSEEVLFDNMMRLRKENISFALDDYGSGFANINYLIRFPFSIVKMDMEIVRAAMTDEKGLITLKHTIAMCKELHLEIVAEGVETPEMANKMTELGCDYIQGFHYAKPSSVTDFIATLERGPSPASGNNPTA